MTEFQKTLAFAASALVLAGAAFLPLRGQSGPAAGFDDQGKPFFPEFTDSAATTTLEVIDYDPATAQATPFQVTRLSDREAAEAAKKDGKPAKLGRWAIPSHHNYPADAKDRLAKTSAGVIDLAKDTIRSDRAEDHEDLGVVDPVDATTTTLKGRGKRVTLKDATGRVLADFIIGNEVKDRPGQRYVRVPGQKRTYGVNLKADLSTKFADWIETNLLKLEAAKIRKVAFDSTKVDPGRGAIVPGEKYELERADASAPWTLSTGIPEGQEVDPEKSRGLVDALADLKIAGVRVKPAGVNKYLKADEKMTANQQRAALGSLISKGFYPDNEGRLLSTQGDVVVSAEGGAVYTLRFGELSLASGEALSAGEDEAADAAKAKDAKAATKGGSESRYLLVGVAFDPTLVKLPPPPAEPPVKLPDDPFWKAPDDPKRLAEEKDAREKADARKAADDKAIAEAKTAVDGLADRFAAWYYVTPGDSFRKIQLDRATLLHPKGAAGGADGGGPPDLNNLPGFPGGMPRGVPNMPRRRP